MSSEARLAILFADISGSSELYQALGDAKALEAVAACLELLGSVTEDFDGRVIKTIGDEIMATFPDVDAANRAAKRMQERIAERRRIEGQHLEIRIGFHYGVAIDVEGDVFGDAVNMAARVASAAKSGQILTTAETVAAMCSAESGSTREIDRATLRGRRDRTSLFEVLWASAEHTLQGKVMWDTPTSIGGARLVVSHSLQAITIDAQHPRIALGRSPECEIVIEGPRISRSHARIEYRKGRFVLVDQSINGTYVVADSGRSTFVRRDEFILLGSGAIQLGGDDDEAHSPIRYEGVS